MGDRLRRIPARTRTRSGACLMDTYMRTAPTEEEQAQAFAVDLVSSGALEDLIRSVGLVV